MKMNKSPRERDGKMEPLSRAGRSQTDKDQKIRKIVKAERATLTETEKCSSFAQNLRVRF